MFPIQLLIRLPYSADKLYVKLSHIITAFKALPTPEMGSYMVSFLTRTEELGLVLIVMRK